MSEQLFKPNQNALTLSDFTSKLIKGKVSREKVIAIQEKLTDAVPMDFIAAVDHLVQQQPVTNELKVGINNMLNVFYTFLSDLKQPVLSAGTFLDQLVKDNVAIIRLMDSFKPIVKEVQKLEKPSDELFAAAKEKMKTFSGVDRHYQVMENVLFPFLEKQWPGHRCLQVLWSVHDDAREEIKELQKLFEVNTWNLKRFNRLTGDLYFNLKTIIFREEKILLPAIVEAGFSDDLDAMVSEVAEIGWSFVEAGIKHEKTHPQKENLGQGFVDFATGRLSSEQIGLIFNHLPVDLTFVDEHDTVRYFSTPKKRTFTRTNAVIGRKVQNCHPPESVHMVEDILDAFKNGEQDDASFWISFKDQFVLIRYFAIRDSEGQYRGTIEVTQDVNEIRSLKGERRLLHWKNNSKV